MTSHQNEDKKGGNYLSLGELSHSIQPFFGSGELCAALTQSELDGGFSGLPALYIVKETFDRLAYDLKVDDEIKPCDVFQMIIGTGKGGIDALLYGRLRMTPSEAIGAYLQLVKAMSNQQAETKEELESNNDKFATAFIQILNGVGLSAETPLRDDSIPCKTVLLTVSDVDLNKCNPLRTYRARKQPTPSCTILEAARAAISSPGFFHPVQIGNGSNMWASIDATTRYPNPVQKLLRQAQDFFGRDEHVATILSVGAGHPNINSLDVEGDTSGNFNDVLRRVAGDCEGKHEEMYGRLKTTGTYFRLNVERGLDHPLLWSEESASTVQAHTDSYLQREAISDLVDEVVGSLNLRKCRVTLKQLNSIEVVVTMLKSPPAAVRNFVGRRDVLVAIYATHFNHRLGEVPSPILSLITGLGGVGKTQISVQLLLEYRKRFPASPVYFVDARSKAQLEEDLQTIIRSLGDGYESKTYKDALVWLSNVQKSWLIIYDNADDPSLRLHPYLPRSDQGHTVISSRNYDLREIAPLSHHHIGGLPEGDAIILLLVSSCNESNEVNQKLAGDIAERLGYLPLALSHAASYIYQNNCLDTFLDIYDQHRAKILSRMPNELPEDYPLSVNATIEMSFERLTPKARDFLTLVSFFHTSGVHREVLTGAAKRGFDHVNCQLRGPYPPDIQALANDLKEIFYVNGTWSEYDFHEMAKECRQYSLLQESSTNGSAIYIMHLLVRSWLHDRLSIQETSKYQQLAVRLLSAFITKQDPDTYWAPGQLISSHLKQLPENLVLPAEDSYQISWILRDSGHYTEARSQCQNALNDLDLAEDKNRLEVSKVMRSLATVSRLSGLLEEPRKLAEKALSIQVQLLTEEEPEMLLTMQELANCYDALGLYKMAFPIREKVLSTHSRVSGEEHPYTLLAMTSIADTLFYLNRDQEAFDMEVKVLELRRRVSGEEHPETLFAMGSLAASHSGLGRHQEALDIETKVLEVMKRLYGEEHPETLFAMGNLADSLSLLGRHHEALDMQTKILEIRKKVLSQEHPDTILVTAQLTRSLSALGRHQEALDILTKSLEIRMRVSGEEHPDTLMDIGMLASLLSKLGQHPEALAMWTRLVEIQKRLYGEENLSTLISMGHVAASLSHVDRHEEAVDLQRKVLEMRNRVSGEEHSTTLIDMSNLAKYISKLGQYQEALAIRTKLCDTRKRLLGEEHPDTLLAMANLGVLLSDMGRWDEALSLEQHVLAKRRSVLGDHHLNTIVSMKNLRKTLSHFGRDEDASKLKEEIERLEQGSQGETTTTSS